MSKLPYIDLVAGRVCRARRAVAHPVRTGLASTARVPHILAGAEPVPRHMWHRPDHREPVGGIAASASASAYSKQSVRGGQVPAWGVSAGGNSLQPRLVAPGLSHRPEADMAFTIHRRFLTVH